MNKNLSRCQPQIKGKRIKIKKTSNLKVQQKVEIINEAHLIDQEVRELVASESDNQEGTPNDHEKQNDSRL